MKKLSYPTPNKLLIEKPSLKKYLRYLLFFGPGAVLVSMTIGQGQLIIGPQIGAWAGFTLLWLITLNLGSYIIAYIGCRFTLLSGISVMDLFSIKTKKGWLNWLFIIIILIFIPLFTATIINSLGQSVSWIVGRGHPLAWGILFSLFAAFLVIIGRYRALEYTQAFFVAVLGIGAVLAVIMIKPDVFDVIPNFFAIGNIPSYPNWVDDVTGFTKTPVPLSMLAFLGTLTISLIPLVGYLGWIKVKKWGIFRGKDNPEDFSKKMFRIFEDEHKINYLPDDEEEIKKSRLLLKPLLIDLSVAFILVSIISAAYMIAGKELLGREHLLPSDINLLREQARIFTSLATWLEPLYKISVFFALFGTIYAGFEAVTRMLFETSKNVIKRIEKLHYRKFMLFLLIYILCTSLPLALFMNMGLSILLVLSITLLFIGVIGVIFYGLGVIYITQTVLPERYKLGKLGLIIGIIGVVLLFVPMIFFVF
jgi:Mn2+/Fe2+ NRAMP family transporter